MDYAKAFQSRNDRGGFAQYVGITLKRVENGYAEGEIVLEERHMNPAGSVHGGCLFALMDTVGGAAAITRGNYVTTANSSISYLRPAANTKKVRAVAREIKNGRTLMLYCVEIFNDAGQLLTRGDFTFYRLQQGIEDLLKE